MKNLVWMFLVIGLAASCGDDSNGGNANNAPANNENNGNSNNTNNLNNLNNTNNLPMGRVVDVAGLLQRQLNPQAGQPCAANEFIDGEDTASRRRDYGYDGQGLIVIEDRVAENTQRIVSEYAGVKLRERIWLRPTAMKVERLDSYSFDDDGRVTGWETFLVDDQGDGTQLKAEPSTTTTVNYDTLTWTTTIGTGDQTETHVTTWDPAALSLKVNETKAVVTFLDAPSPVELANFFLLQPSEISVQVATISVDDDEDLAVDSTTSAIYTQDGVLSTLVTDDGSGSQVQRLDFVYECGT